MFRWLGPLYCFRPGFFFFDELRKVAVLIGAASRLLTRRWYCNSLRLGNSVRVTVFFFIAHRRAKQRAIARNHENATSQISMWHAAEATGQQMVDEKRNGPKHSMGGEASGPEIRPVA